MGRLHGRCKMMSRSYCKCPDKYLVVFAGWRRDDRTTCSLSSQWRWKCEPSGSGNCNMKCGNNCVISSCQWWWKCEPSGNGIATRVVEGVVDACCLSRCICCQCRLCLLAEQSIVNGSCRNRGNTNCGSCCAACLVVEKSIEATVLN